jgi:hypothetical protein
MFRVPWPGLTAEDESPQYAIDFARRAAIVVASRRNGSEEMPRSFLPILTAVIALIAMAAFGQTVGPQSSALAPGQMWSIKSASPTTTKVIIGRLEDWNGKSAVHVALVDVPVPAGVPGAGGVIGVGHMPFEQSTLAASLNEMISTGASPGPNFENGYAQWQAARGGIYTISVADAVSTLFEALAKGRPAQK